MKVNLTIQVGECAVIHELTNVQEHEFAELTSLARQRSENVTSFTWDGGLKEMYFSPASIKVIHATRSEP